MNVKVGSVIVSDEVTVMLVGTGDFNGEGAKLVALKSGNRWSDTIIPTVSSVRTLGRETTLDEIKKVLNENVVNRVSAVYSSVEEYIERTKAPKIIIQEAQQDKQITEEEIENTARKAWVTITDTLSATDGKPISNANYKMIRLMTHEFSKLIKGDKK